MHEIGHKHESNGLFLALIGDVVASRAIEDRLGFQDRLKRALAAANREVGDPSLAAPLALTAGDEFQGLFRRGAPALDALIRLSEELAPVRLAFGLGVGGLSTGASVQVAEMDGPVFHRARAALERVRKGDGWAAVEGLGEVSDRAAGALFGLLHALRSRWTGKQMAYVRAARVELQKDVAARFGVSPSVVSESLKAAAFDAAREGEAALGALLSAFGPEAEPGRDSVVYPEGSE